MCIIAIKKKGIELPNEETLKTMFDNNSDGAGFMYSENNKVVIRKGFMNFYEFKKELFKVKNAKDTTIVMHFRIATSGKIDAGTCHPFPISKAKCILKKTSFVTDIGIVHNGIISIKTKDDFSDTMQYIADKVTKYKTNNPQFYKSRRIMKKIEDEIQSKMVFLTPNGRFYKVGNFITEKDGMIYSNTSYRKREFTYFDDIDSCYYSLRKSLCIIDGYIIDESGTFLDSENSIYLIDKNGTVYEYDYFYDYVMPLYGASAYTYLGMAYRFDPKKAEVYNTWF